MKQHALFNRGFLILTLAFSMLGLSTLSYGEEKTATQEVWIDVRTSAENMMNGIEGDTHIPYDEIVPEVSKLYSDKNTEIHVYCKSGGRAQKALDALQSAGYTKVKNMGGIEDVKKLRGIQ